MNYAIRDFLFDLEHCPNEDCCPECRCFDCECEDEEGLTESQPDPLWWTAP